MQEELNVEGIRQQDALWARIVSRIKHVPSKLVRDTPYDSWVPEWMVENLKRANKDFSSKYGSHLGKEMGLMLTGKKRCAIVDSKDIDHWFSHLLDNKFLAIIDPEDCYSFIVIHYDDLDIIEDMIDGLKTVMGDGLVQGYSRKDIHAYIKEMDAWIAEKANPHQP